MGSVQSAYKRREFRKKVKLAVGGSCGKFVVEVSL
jgi:hypothetical protein